jgi:hypothetical protein
MTRDEFMEFYKDKSSKLQELLQKKNNEYSNGLSAFYNFEEGLAISTCETREELAWNFMTKHLQSMKDIITNKTGTDNLIAEKASDIILYTYLIWAMKEETNIIS